MYSSVEAVAREQLFVPTALHNLAPVEHENQVRVADGGEPVLEDRDETKHPRVRAALAYLKAIGLLPDGELVDDVDRPGAA